MSPRSSMESVTSEISKVQSQASQVSSQEVRVAWVEQIVKHRRDFRCRTRKKYMGGAFLLVNYQAEQIQTIEFLRNKKSQV